MKFRHRAISYFIYLLRGAAFLWFVLGITLIVGGYLAIFIQHGWSGLMDLLSPFNWRNTIAVMLTLAPGYGLMKLADWLDHRTIRVLPLREPSDLQRSHARSSEPHDPAHPE